MNSTVNILIVDDTPVILKILEKELLQHQFNVTAASSGEQAINILKDKKIDLIMLDVVMSGMDGYETSKKIKANPKTNQIPIIFLTASDDTKSIVQGFQAGAADYVIKPFRAEELIARAKTHIDLKRSKEDLRNALKVMEEDLKTAHNIQRGILPKNLNKIKELKIIDRYYPLNLVGGDFYDIIKLEEGWFRCFIADATGHGVQSALITMVIQSLYQNLKTNYEQPKILLESLNTIFYDKYKSLNTFFSGIIVDINLNNKELIYASGGHPDQILLSSQFGIQTLSHSGPLLGVMPNIQFRQQKLNFFSQDKLFLFTDGIFEEYNSQYAFFSEERLYKLISESNDLEIEHIVEKIFYNLNQYLEGNPKQDDITLIGISANENY